MPPTSGEVPGRLIIESDVPADTAEAAHVMARQFEDYVRESPELVAEVIHGLRLPDAHLASSSVT